MTRNLRHLELAHLWFKEIVADGTCIIEKVDSKENNSDIGTKRVPKAIPYRYGKIRVSGFYVFGNS